MMREGERRRRREGRDGSRREEKGWEKIEISELKQMLNHTHLVNSNTSWDH